MKKIIKRLYIYTSLAGITFLFCINADAQTTMPDQASPTKQIKVTITKENLNTSIDSLILKDLENKINIDKTILNDLNNDFSDIDILNINDAPKKAEDNKTETENAEKQDVTQVIQQDAEYKENPNIHDVSFSELRDDSRIKQNDTSYKKAVLNGNNLIDAANRQFISDIRTAIAADNIKQAESMLDQALYNIKNDSWSLAEIASIYETMGLSSKAENAYQKAVSTNPNRIEILYNTALHLYKNNKLSKAEYYLNKITKISPQFTLAYYNLGNIYFKQKKYNMALKAFSKATETNPLCSDAYFNIAIILETLNHKTLALKYYEKYLQLEPKDALAQQAIKRLTKS